MERVFRFGGVGIFGWVLEVLHLAPKFNSAWLSERGILPGVFSGVFISSVVALLLVIRVVSCSPRGLSGHINSCLDPVYC